jgi:hypothetical protein
MLFLWRHRKAWPARAQLTVKHDERRFEFARAQVSGVLGETQIFLTS